MTKSAVKSRANSIPSHHHILAATQLGELNALLSAEAENKGKFPGSPAKPGPANPHESVKFGPAYATSLSCHVAMVPSVFLRETREIRNQPWDL